MISLNLERIVDLATDLDVEVIYVAGSEIDRHNGVWWCRNICRSY